MASISTISLPHGTIPTQMFGNVNLQNAMMYVNENFSAVKEGVNEAVATANEAIAEKADADHDHDEDYAASDHTHAQSEIIGLSSALDGKAELNHTHPQYLSSLPAHYHGTTEIYGLDAQLQAKAEKAHTHEMSGVNGLATELGTKASIAYVDQKTNQINEQSNSLLENAAKQIGSSQTKMGGFPEGEVEQTAEVLWTANNASGKGAKLMMLFKGENESGTGNYAFYACQMTISKSGLITKIETLKNSGIVVYIM